MIKATHKANPGSKPLDKGLIGPKLPGSPGAVMTADQIQRPRGFYRGVHIPDLSKEAACWTPGTDLPSGSAINQKITGIYTQLDKGMTAYLGEPRTTNWSTFGKYASANAGVQITRLEALMTTLQKKGLKSGLALLADGLTNPKESLAAARAINEVDLPGRSFMDKVAILRRALVNGNVAIINDIAPAFDTFLRAESGGKDGVAALRAAGFGREPLDRHGLILQAFERYAEARKIGDQMLQDYTPDQLEAFEKTWRTRELAPDRLVSATRNYVTFVKDISRRQNLTLQANLLLGFHEQLVSLQSPEVFDNPDVAKMMEVLSRGMVFEDVRGKTPLLPNGGNWADFTKRMGLTEVSPDATFNPLAIDGLETTDMLIELKDPDGRVRKYFTSGLCEAGNIAYFMSQAHRAFDENTDRLLESKPKPLPWLFKVSQ